MDKQIKNIQLLADGSIKFKTGRVEKPKNTIYKIESDVVFFLMNKDRYIGKVDVSNYFRLSLWAHKLTFDHADIRKGVIAYDNGYEHKSLPAAIVHTEKLIYVPKVKA